MTAIYHRPKGFKRCIVQTLSAAITGDSTGSTITTDAPHGLAVGDAVALTALGGTTGTALLTRYFVVAAAAANTLQISATRGGAAIAVGVGADIGMNALIETAFAWPQKAAASNETASITWEGGNAKSKEESLDGVTLQLDFDASNKGAHATVFGKSPITGALPGGITNAIGFGGGKDKAGVSCGVRLEADAIKSENGVESNVNFYRWFPMGTLTLKGAGDIQTSAKAGVTSYSFSAVRTLVDLLGDTIEGASSDGEFYYEGEA
jgi:hypothetical protein